MKCVWLFLVYFVIVSAEAFAAKATGQVSYEGYKVYRFTPISQNQVDYLKSLEGAGVIIIKLQVWLLLLN